MEEEQKEKKQVPKKEKVRTPKILDEANKAAERLEAANKQMAELLQQKANLEAEKVLGGRASAGKEQEKPMTKDDLAIIEARKMLAGTGFADELFPEKT